MTDARTRALVLGGGGFIGRHLAARLAALASFHRIEIAGANLPAECGTLHAHPGDVDAALLARCATPDVIFWAIGGASVAASLTDPARDFTRSIPPLAAVLDRLAGPWRTAHLVFLSSAAVYGSGATGCTSTQVAPRPMSPYGAHKQMSEEMIAGSSAADGWTATIVRPFSVYGPGLRRQLFWDALQKAARGDTLFHGTGRELRDWVHVRDLSALLADIGNDPGRFPTVINAGSGRPVPVEQALRTLFSLVPGVPPPRFDGAARSGDPGRLVADATEQAPFARYFCTSLAEGLADYVRWYRALPR